MVLSWYWISQMRILWMYGQLWKMAPKVKMGIKRADFLLEFLLGYGSRWLFCVCTHDTYVYWILFMYVNLEQRHMSNFSRVLGDIVLEEEKKILEMGSGSNQDEWLCRWTLSLLCLEGFKEARIFWEVREDSQSSDQQQYIICWFTGEAFTLEIVM